MSNTHERFKTLENVFDETTLRTIFKLSSQGYFDDLKSPISIGKESNVFTAVKNKEEVIAVKIYRVNNCDFNKMYNYIKSDERFKGLTAQRRKVIYTWALREYHNLLLARKAGVSVPTPYAVHQNVLVLEFIGIHGMPAPKLKDAPPQDLKKFSQLLLLQLKKLTMFNLVHGDLSEYNILNFHEKPVLIDFSHATRLTNPGSEYLLERDIDNVVRYFTKRGLKLTKEKVYTTINHGRIPLRN